MDIRDLELSTRTFNALRSAGVCTVEEAKQMSDHDLMRLPNFGRKALREWHEVMRGIDNLSNNSELIRRRSLEHELRTVKQALHLLVDAPTARNLMVIHDRLDGDNYAVIGRRYGITGQTVKSIVERYQRHMRHAAREADCIKPDPECITPPPEAI